MTQSSPRRTRRSPQQWKEIVAAYDARRESADDFFEQHGVASSSVHFWRKKLATPAARRRADPSNRIVPIRIEAPALFELVLPSGFTLRFPTSIDEASLRAVLLALEPR